MMGASTWETPADQVDNSWKMDGGFSGEFPEANISKHAGGDFENGDAPADGGCRICKSDAHFARDCPDKPEGFGACFNCGEQGHKSSECTNERVEREFTGTCRICEVAGHRAADCPQAPPAKCKACNQEGHSKDDCGANRVHVLFQSLKIGDMSAEEAWKALEDADKEKDVEEIKKAIFAYAKAFPDLTLVELETTFRDAEMNTHLIAKDQAIADTHTIISLQGVKDQKFVVSYQFSDKPKRAKFAEGWPSSKEENQTRLAEAGFVMDGLVMKCSNCGQLGHGRSTCSEEKNEGNKVAITCAVCDVEGHRARDCNEPRKSGKKGCKNCGSEEHMVKECPEPRTDLECRDCGETGHMSRDCPSKAPEQCRNCFEVGHCAKDCTNERVMKCRNCDAIGHQSRECPQPTDWSRVQCKNCGEKGHGAKRCTQPPKPEEDADDAGASGGNGGDWETPAVASAGGDCGWETSAAASGGGGGGW